ncbi:MAG: hypothetical protein OXG51_13800, partial [Gammaproteobacteria bacterium]|nr:hypothetical protein [Gammaproteobacteria bacterium]
HNTVLPIDHPFWKTHAPPNGWNCRCTLVALSERDLDRYGLSLSQDPGFDLRPWTNRRTGEIVQVPQGIDPGFAHNPGTLPAVSTPVRLYNERLVRAPGALRQSIDDAGLQREARIRELDAGSPLQARDRVRALQRSAEFEEHVQGLTEGDFPVAMLESTTSGMIGGTGAVVRLSQETAAKQRFRHPDVEPADYRRLQRLFDDGIVFQESASSVVAFLEENGQWWYAAVKSTRVGELYLVTYHRSRPGQLRRAEGRFPRLSP